MRTRTFSRILLTVLCAALFFAFAGTALAAPCYYDYPIYPVYPAYPVYPTYPIVQPVQVVTPTTVKTDYFSATQYLNIRGGASTKSPIIGYVNAGVVVKRIGTSGAYTQIQTNCGNSTAYVYTDYLVPYIGADAASRVVYPPCQLTTTYTYQPVYWGNMYNPVPAPIIPAPVPVPNPYPPCCR